MKKSDFNLSHLKDIRRLRIPENRDLSRGLRLNRNEKVTGWPKDFLTDVYKSKPDYFLSIYPDLSPLYNKISRHDGIKESNLLLTSGIDGAMKTIWEVYTQPGDRIGVPGPTYAMYYVYSKIYRTKLTEIPYKPDTFEIDRRKLKRFLDSKPKIFFLPNPNQPIEDTFSKDEIYQLAKITKKNGTLLIIDEAYLYFGSETAISLVEEFSNLIVMRTFSKGFGMPSIRLGYMASSEGNMEYFSKTRFAHETSGLSAAVAEYALDNFEIISDYNSKVQSSRDKIKNLIEGMGYRCHGSLGNYLLIDLKKKSVLTRFLRTLDEKKIYVKSGFSEPWNNCILITVGPYNKMSKFISTVSTVL
jgi:histidinol-phosphate aminotransferase